ncbi:Thiamine transporter 2 [Camponotus japonicus]
MHWIKISCILCMVGCFKDFRPSEPFVTDYLTEWKHFEPDQVNRDIFPVYTYSYLATLIIVFLITDFVRYKPIIILCGLSGILTFSMIIFGRTLLIFQILEFFHGLYLSTEVAYYTYIYAKVDKRHYQEVTSRTKAASLFGRSMAAIVAQLTTSFNLLDYHQLNYLTISANIFATIWAFFLPPVNQSIYFHRASISDEQSKESFDYQTTEPTEYRCIATSNTEISQFRKIKNAYALLWRHFLQAYTNYRVVKLSIWWALATCGYLQVLSYAQLLWQDAVEKGDMIYNGAVDFLYAIIGAGTVFCVGKMKLNWSLLGDVTLSIFSFLEGIILVAASYNRNIWFLYAGYIIFGVIYHTMVTVTSFEVAKYISEDSYGLIFGVTMFFALLVQSLLTFVVVNKLTLSIRHQFFIYGGFFVVLAVIYFLMGVHNLVQHYRSGEVFRLWINDDDKSLSTTRNASSSSDVISSKTKHNGSINGSIDTNAA